MVRVTRRGRAVACGLIVATLVLPSLGCTADPNSPRLQSAAIKNPRTRAQAIANTTRLYEQTFARAHGLRSDRKLRAFLTATIPNLVSGYHASRQDDRSGRKILRLLAKYDDVRAAPAFVEACGVRHRGAGIHLMIAIRAIRDLEKIPRPEERRLADALRSAFVRLPGDRPAVSGRLSDEALQMELIDSLKLLGDSGAAALARIYQGDLRRSSPDVVRKVAEELSSVATPETIPALIQALFPRRECRLRPTQDLAFEGLAHVGSAAVEPLLRVLRLEDPQALATANSALALLGPGPPSRSGPWTAVRFARSAAIRALGELGVSEATPALLQVAASGSLDERLLAVRVLAVLRLDEASSVRLGALIGALLHELPRGEDANQRSMLLRVALQRFDPRMLPTLLAAASDPTEHVSVRLFAVESYATLAVAGETLALEQLIAREPPGRLGGLHESFQSALPLLALARACDLELGCWQPLLQSTDSVTVRKAATMIGRLGSGDSVTTAALVSLFDHEDLRVRLAALSAVEHLVTDDAPSVVARLEALMRLPESAATRGFNPSAIVSIRRFRSRRH